MNDLPIVGTISRVAGPFLIAKGMTGSKMYELVHVGEVGVIGEIIRLQGENASIQAYEDTAGIKPGEKVQGTGRAVYSKPGPGNLGEKNRALAGENLAGTRRNRLNLLLLKKLQAAGDRSQ